MGHPSKLVHAARHLLAGVSVFFLGCASQVVLTGGVPNAFRVAYVLELLSGGLWLYSRWRYRRSLIPRYSAERHE